MTIEAGSRELEHFSRRKRGGVADEVVIEGGVMRAPGDEVVCAPLDEGIARVAPGPDDFVVVTTRTHGLDLKCVRAALATRARYVGLLASRKKAEVVRATLAREGVDASRLHAPVGLDLAAKSAGEIAVSVVAQLIKVRRLGRGDR